MKSFIICLVIVGIGFQLGSAQRNGPEQRAKMQERIEAQRVAFITQKLALTPDESAKFWPLYNEFRNAQKSKREALRPNVPINQLSDSEADKLIDKQLTTEIELVELKRTYFGQLKDVISSQQIVQLGQIEMEFNRGILEKLKQRQGQGPNRNRD